MSRGSAGKLPSLPDDGIYYIASTGGRWGKKAQIRVSNAIAYQEDKDRRIAIQKEYEAKNIERIYQPIKPSGANTVFRQALIRFNRFQTYCLYRGWSLFGGTMGEYDGYISGENAAEKAEYYTNIVKEERENLAKSDYDMYQLGVKLADEVIQASLNPMKLID